MKQLIINLLNQDALYPNCVIYLLLCQSAFVDIKLFLHPTYEPYKLTISQSQ